MDLAGLKWGTLWLNEGVMRMPGKSTYSGQNATDHEGNEAEGSKEDLTTLITDTRLKKEETRTTRAKHSAMSTLDRHRFELDRHHKRSSIAPYFMNAVSFAAEATPN